MTTNFILKACISMTFVTALLLTSGCKKDDNNDDSENWTAAVASSYTGTGDNLLTNDPKPVTTIVTRINDKMLNFQFSFFGTSYCLDSVSMNSPSTFSINEYDACGNETRTGGGNFSDNNINFTICCYAASYQLTVNGTK
jgi:hypothetical protein